MSTTQLSTTDMSTTVVEHDHRTPAIPLFSHPAVAYHVENATAERMAVPVFHGPVDEVPQPRGVVRTRPTSTDRRTRRS
ncbi:hypothetical protein [Actinokineospora sp. NBRC 105648]|uniref:hypothetical protein n=1 Tax=Actinokineospora sp. NBRC 105648 TaxID=3032206 RepID=UPI0024A2AFFF|nr:hypothetical protein [Actinokineospora sp. NBRC 105648]GLZ41949.1 hypothetical protein Acsp05_55730 [Actinokineospora sp. NBRC 105648]